MSGRLLHRPLVRASSTASAPAARDVGAFHAQLDRMGSVARARELAALQADSASLARELDTLGTFPRQLAHMLLVRPVLKPVDLLNPAAAWQDTEPVEEGAFPFARQAGGAAREVEVTQSSAVAGSAVEEEALLAFEGSAVAEAAALRQRKPASAAPAPDASPPIGGALSFVSAGEFIPGPGPTCEAPNPVGLLYIDALAEYLQGAVLPRLQRRATAAAAAAPPSAHIPPERLQALLAACAPRAPPLSLDLTAWLSALPAAHAAELAGALSHAREGGAPAFAARAAALSQAMRVLQEARAGTLGRPSGSPPCLPTARTLHNALDAAIASASAASPSLEAFIQQHSAASAVAEGNIHRLHAAVATLNACAAHTLAAKVMLDKVAQRELPLSTSIGSAGGGEGGAGAGAGAGAAPPLPPTFTLAHPVPTVATVLALPGLEIPTLELLEAPTGLTHSLALGPAQASHVTRLAAGHVPTMLSPLLRILTPTEWGACLALVRVSLPDLSPYLLPPVSLPSGSGSGSGSSGSGGGGSGGGSAATSFSSVSQAGDIVGEFGVATSIEGGGVMLNASGISNSDLNALVPAALGVTGEAGGAFTPSPTHTVASAAPNAASRDEYLRYLLRARAARVLLSDTRDTQASAAAKFDAMEAAARAAGSAEELEGVAALRANYALITELLQAGERVGDEAEALRALRRAEVAGDPHAGDPPSSRLLNTFKAMGPGVGEGSINGGIAALSRAMEGSAPAASGPLAAARACGVPGVLGRVWWGPGMPLGAGEARASAPSDGGAARLLHPTPAAMGWGGLAGHASHVTAPGSWGGASAGAGAVAGAGAAMAGAPGLPPRVPEITALGSEDSGGVLQRAQAEGTQVLLEEGIWPPVPRLLPWDLSWASRRAEEGFLKASTSGLEDRNAAVRGAAPIGLPLHCGGSGSGSGSGGGSGSVGGSGSGGNLATAATPLDAGTVGPQSGLQAARLASAARARRLSQRLHAGGAEAQAAVSEHWTAFAFAPLAGYREPSRHELVHQRLLEACNARDLGAVWALWSEHCRLHPQGGAPDILALEIVMDAAARAQRSDLVYHVLWPRAMALRIVPTPAMWLILLKCAALEGNAEGALALLNGLAREGLAQLDARHYSAAISACLGAGRFGEAIELFNRMRRAHLAPRVGLFEAFFVHLGASGRADQCALVWRAMLALPALPVPRELYARIIATFARCGNLQAMEEVVARMRRPLDGSLKPTAPSLCAIFDAYLAAGSLGKAADTLALIEASGQCSAAEVASRQKGLKTAERKKQQLQ